MSVTINKNGRNFIVECIIFQDASFRDFHQRRYPGRRASKAETPADPKYCPRIENAGKQHTRLSGNDCEQRKHRPRKMQVFLERCYAQSNRLSRLLRDISVLTRMDEAANMIDMELHSYSNPSVQR